MKSIQIHDSRFIYDEERMCFLPLIRVEDKDKKGVLFWTLFNTDLFNEEWDIEPVDTTFMTPKEFSIMLNTYGDFQPKTNNLGFGDRIWNNLGVRMDLDDLKTWTALALYKHITLEDLKGTGMGVQITDKITGEITNLSEVTVPLPFDLKPIWDVKPQYLSQCPGFKKKHVREFYAIVIDDKKYFSNLSTKEESYNFEPYVKTINSVIVCKKFKTEDDALEFTTKHRKHFAKVGYEIQHFDRPAYI